MLFRSVIDFLFLFCYNIRGLVDVDIYQKLFIKMAKLGFPDEYKGFNMIYYFRNYQVDVKLFPTVKKIYKMWELLNE